MKRYYILPILLIFLLGFASSQSECEPVIIDDFINSTIDSRWYVYEGNNPTLTNLGYLEKSMNSTNNAMSYPRFWKQNLNLDLESPIADYNISFWYYKVSTSPDCVSGVGVDYSIAAEVGELDVDDPDGEWRVFLYRVEAPSDGYPARSCNEWYRFNRALSEFDWWNWEFNSSATHIGLFGFNIAENPDTTVLFDEVEIMLKVPCCQENWQCGSWTVCTVEGIQTRNCIDSNGCGTVYNKSSELQSCTYTPGGCIPSWDCFAWGSCIGGIQSRTCYDINSCGTLSGQPQTSQSCVTPMLSVNAHVANTFERTDTITVSGNVTDAARVLTNADVGITLTSGSFSVSFQHINSSEFESGYTIKQSDPVGTWTVGISASDGVNIGLWEKEISVFEEVSFDTYNVVFTSPDEGAPYRRGDEVIITVRVEQDGVGIQGADVFIYISNEELRLAETTPGTYYTRYKVPYTSNLGTLPISVRAEKGNMAGTKTVKIYVLPATLNVALTSPMSASVGLKTTVSVNVTYPDGTQASGLSLSVGLPNGSLSMTEMAPGIYTAEYVPVSIGDWNLEVNVVDAYANVGNGYRTITFIQFGIIDFLGQYWYFIIAAVVAVGLVGYFATKRRVTSNRYNDLVREGQRILKMQKELQQAYFELNEIDMETFKQKTAEYEKRLTQIREEAERLKPGEQ